MKTVDAISFPETVLDATIQGMQEVPYMLNASTIRAGATAIRGVMAGEYTWDQVLQASVTPDQTDRMGATINDLGETYNVKYRYDPQAPNGSPRGVFIEEPKNPLLSREAVSSQVRLPLRKAAEAITYFAREVLPPQILRLDRFHQDMRTHGNSSVYIDELFGKEEYAPHRQALITAFETAEAVLNQTPGEESSRVYKAALASVSTEGQIAQHVWDAKAYAVYTKLRKAFSLEFRTEVDGFKPSYRALKQLAFALSDRRVDRADI